MVTDNRRTSVTAFVNMTPASSNAKSSIGGRSNRQAAARVKGEWEGHFLAALMAAKLPRKIDRVWVQPELKFRRNGKAPDPDNFYFPISKPLGDALQKALYIPDDDPSHYRCDRPKMTMGATDLPQLVKGKTIIVLTFAVTNTCGCGYQWWIYTEQCPKCGGTTH